MFSMWKKNTYITFQGTEQGKTWIFNPPHSSHMGGVWLRMIGTTRRILDLILLDCGSKCLTHEVITTFVAEGTSIFNSRPLVPVSRDPCILPFNSKNAIF